MEWTTLLHRHCKAHLFLHRLSVASALSMLPILILTFPTHWKWHQWHSQPRTSQVLRVPLVDVSCPYDGFPHLHRPATLAIHRDVAEHPLALKSSRTAPRPRINKKLSDSVDFVSRKKTYDKIMEYHPYKHNDFDESPLLFLPLFLVEVGGCSFGLRFP